MKKILGVITARGGSKGITGKNIKELGGKPLLVYTIEAAQKSGVFDRIILSTDDEAIANVGKENDCEVAFQRPGELAKDDTPHLPVMQHAVGTLGKEGYSADYVAILQPTAPFRQPFHIKEAIELLLKTNADSVFTVNEIPGHHNPHWTVTLDEQGFATLLATGEPVRKRIPRRQDLPKAYVNSGALYVFKTDLLFGGEPNFYGDKAVAYVMDDKFSINLDAEEDWETAESRLKRLQKEGYKF